MRSLATKKYVLYADDDADDQQDMFEVFQEINEEVIVLPFKNGLELARFAFDVESYNNLPLGIIIDMNMPVWDGLQTLKALLIKPAMKNIPVVMVSAGLDGTTKKLALQLGATFCASKPIYAGEWDGFKKMLSHLFLHVEV